MFDSIHNRCCLKFFSSSDSIFYVGNKVCARWEQKEHQKLEKYDKKEFSEYFFSAEN